MDVKVENLAHVLNLLHQIQKLERLKGLGEVYSSGASQGRKRYERYVQDDDNQADIHRGRWQTVQSVAQAKRPDVEGIFRDALSVISNDQAPNIGPAVDRALTLLLAAMQLYPPPPAGSRYVRTETLKRSWRTKNQAT